MSFKRCQLRARRMFRREILGDIPWVQQLRSGGKRRRKTLLLLTDSNSFVSGAQSTRIVRKLLKRYMAPQGEHEPTTLRLTVRRNTTPNRGKILAVRIAKRKDAL